MAKKSKLLSALDAHKGKDFKAERERKLRKVAEKKKRSKSQPADEQDRAIGLGSDDGETQIDEEAVRFSYKLRIVHVQPFVLLVVLIILNGLSSVITLLSRVVTP